MDRLIEGIREIGRILLTTKNLRQLLHKVEIEPLNWETLRKTLGDELVMPVKAKMEKAKLGTTIKLSKQKPINHKIHL